MSKNEGWPGIVPLVKRVLYGGVRVPKLKRYGTTSTPTGSENYETMHKDYRWFRQDEMVRRCVIINAMFATMTAGFETELEPVGDVDDPEAFVKKYEGLKEHIDAINKKVNLDQILFISQVKRSIYKKTGWEMILESPNGTIKWLLSLQSDKLKPNINQNWELEGFKYEGREDAYGPDEVLYFLNLNLENDMLGLGDIEAIRDVCDARHRLLREDFGEITRTLWAPIAYISADTSGMDAKEEDAFLDELMEAAKAGKSLVFNRSVEVTVVDKKIDLMGLVALLDKFEQAIIANFGTPKFLLGKPIENRATAYAELEAFVQGPIAHIQRYFKRQIEKQWYDRWTRQFLKVPEGTPLPVLIKHSWNPIRVTDVYAMATAVTALYSSGLGILGDFEDLAFEMMGWPKERYLKELEKREQLQKEKEPSEE